MQQPASVKQILHKKWNKFHLVITHTDSPNLQWKIRFVPEHSQKYSGDLIDFWRDMKDMLSYRGSMNSRRLIYSWNCQARQLTGIAWLHGLAVQTPGAKFRIWWKTARVISIRKWWINHGLLYGQLMLIGCSEYIHVRVSNMFIK